MQEINLEVKPLENKLEVFFFALGLVIVLAAAAFSAGFALSKSKQISTIFGGEKTLTKATAPAGWQLLDAAEFSIAYPKDWTATAHSAGEPDGATITNPGGKVEVYLTVEMPYQFSDEQKSKQTGKKEGKIKVDGRNGTETEFTYEAGGYFMIIEVPATLTAPKVTFWATAGSDSYKKTALAIIDSFKAKPQNP